MELTKKRIRNLLANLPGELQGQKIVIAAPKGISPSKLVRLGFTSAPIPGTVLLPAVVGPVTRFNAEGRYIVHRDQPKEIKHRHGWWRWTEKHGKDEVEREGLKDVPYERFPRTFVPPLGFELLVVEHEGQPVVVSQEIQVDFEREEALKHIINLFLECFGGCRILRQSMEPVMVAATTRLNWMVLPKGEMPWSRLEPLLSGVIESQSKGKRPVVAFRLEFISRFKPEFVAVGNGGFSGYVVFGFPRRGFFILECAKYANATYVFDKNWEELSQLTKAEVLNNRLQSHRFVHLERWQDQVAKLFQGGQQERAA